jgi:outer membrane lipoprotein carrier protein
MNDKMERPSNEKRTPRGFHAAVGRALAAVSLSGLAMGQAHANAVDDLRQFVRQVHSAQATFTQTVSSPDGKKSRKSTGTLAFERPDRFRFAYTTPTAQLIVGDGKQVWLYDEDLNQVTVRPMTKAVGASPAALLAGDSLDKDFTLKTAPATPDAKGVIEWAEALPRQKDGQFKAVRVGFRQGRLVALEVVDGFGQRSRLDFSQFDTQASVPASSFTFTPPAGADVLKQP